MRASLALVALLAVATLTACGDDSPTAPGNRALDTGRYAFTSDFQIPGIAPTHATGFLTITAATPDELTGFADIDGLSPGDPSSQVPFSVGMWNEDAYLVYAPVAYGVYVWRLAQSGSGITCEGRFLRNVSSGLQSYPATCTVRRAG